MAKKSLKKQEQNMKQHQTNTNPPIQNYNYYNKSKYKIIYNRSNNRKQNHESLKN